MGQVSGRPAGKTTYKLIRTIPGRKCSPRFLSARTPLFFGLCHQPPRAFLFPFSRVSLLPPFATQAPPPPNFPPARPGLGSRLPFGRQACLGPYSLPKAPGVVHGPLYAAAVWFAPAFL